MSRVKTPELPPYQTFGNDAGTCIHKMAGIIICLSVQNINHFGHV